MRIADLAAFAGDYAAAREGYLRAAREDPLWDTTARLAALEHGGDSVTADGIVPLVLGGRAGLTLGVTVLDERDRIQGVVIASGPDAMTRWVPATGVPRLWAAVLDTLRAADSTLGRHDARPVRGRVRVVPLEGAFAYVQPTYLWPVRGEPTRATGTPRRSWVTLPSITLRYGVSMNRCVCPVISASDSSSRMRRARSTASCGRSAAP